MFSPFHSSSGYRTPEDVTGRSVKTKCMVTIGPASSSKYTLGKLLAAGLNVARFNASHGSAESWQESVDNLKAASSETGVTCATLLDIKGPEIRLGHFKDGGTQIEAGQTFTFRTNHVEGDNTQVSIMSWTLWKQLHVGDKLMVDYGKVSFTVKKLSPNTIECVADNGNYIGDAKHVIVRQRSQKDRFFRTQLLSYRDTKDIDFAVRNEFDFICAPICDIAEASGHNFQQATKTIKEAVAQLRSLPGVQENRTKILLKVATKADVEMIEAILDVCDGIVLCRSLLAVHVPVEQVAPVQKSVATLCNERMKTMVVMNHILTSMTGQAQPSRSEATDVANLVLDGVDCLALTSPTARGQFPVETVEMMKRICRETELSLDYRSVYVSRRNAVIEYKTTHKAPAKDERSLDKMVSGRFDANEPATLDEKNYRNLSRTIKIERNDSLASSAVKLAWDVEAAALLVFTDSGVTAQRVALYRPHCQLLALTTNSKVARQLQITWGTVPLVMSSMKDTDAVVDHIVRLYRGKHLLKSNDMLIKLSGVLAEHGASSDHLSAAQVP